VEYLKDKARILVTHQIQFLRDAHKILVLDDGKCVALGSYEELKASGINLMSYHKPNEDLNPKPDPNMAYRRMNRAVSFSPSIASSVGEGSVVTGNDNNVDIEDIKEEEEEQKVKSETKMTGSVETSVYWDYTKAGAGPMLFIVTVLSTIIVQVLYQGGDIWLTQWFVPYITVKFNLY
jgi:ATP-binding cassette subfamily C (CFTR/MRP) protein 4